MKKYRPVIPGYRDQWCPICGAGPFTRGLLHITKMHGVNHRDARRLYGNLTAEQARWSSFSRQEPKDMSGPLGERIRRAQRRHARWFAAVEAERAKGDYWLERLAVRWRVPGHTAKSRVHLLREAGYAIPKVDQRARTCRRGHPRTPENILVEKADNPNHLRVRCMACRREDRARRSRRRGSSP